MERKEKLEVLAGKILKRYEDEGYFPLEWGDEHSADLENIIYKVLAEELLED